ncbi:hypothetical protein X777_14023 [Ooceraea biroi]|uniref:Activin types I and II receptor domain-containing protein n=1 Tax=Ooceraea biroi TaxID=2015173 RepID=A0A026WXM5_OOCBI|nr:hypothetical protein X777_14023 [Ooceraea biroi]
MTGVLKCHCDICPDTNHTCETDGYCFASTSLENDVITYARRSPSARSAAQPSYRTAAFGSFGFDVAIDALVVVSTNERLAGFPASALSPGHD